MLKLERPIYVKDSKNALSPYKLGGTAGGSDFDPKGKTENEAKSTSNDPNLPTSSNVLVVPLSEMNQIIPLSRNYWEEENISKSTPRPKGKTLDISNIVQKKIVEHF